MDRPMTHTSLQVTSTGRNDGKLSMGIRPLRLQSGGGERIVILLGSLGIMETVSIYIRNPMSPMLFGR